MPRPTESFPYKAAAVRQGETLVDVRISLDSGKEWSLAGRGGAERELALAGPAITDPNCIPVFLGAGLGHGLQAALESHSGPVAVIDKETPILEATGIRQQALNHKNCVWIDDPDPGQALAKLTRVQMDHANRPLSLVASPLYLRLDPGYYRLLKEHISASTQVDFWAKAKYAKFTSWPPRMLLITSTYFLMGEVVTACERLGVPHQLLRVPDKETGSEEFVKELLTAIVEFRPDFLFTINHLGVDREGVLIDLIERLEVPLASWFVDNPHLILYFYNRVVSEHTAIYTWDTDNIAGLKDQGFSHVEYLPLGVDAQRFSPPATPIPDSARTDVAFVGNSMVYKVAHRMDAGRFPRELLRGYKEVAARFGEHDERSVRAFLRGHFPERFAVFETLQDKGETQSRERKLAYEAMITWEATRQYRRHCVAQTLDFSPLIVGDPGWDIAFKHEARPWTRQGELNYYADLPAFYPRAKVNFNTTSKQMKGAVNQRVFDAPATGAFVLTDQRDQMENLFEPHTEIAFYNDPGDIPHMVRHFLDNPAERQRIADAARTRILAEHTYEHRLESLMRSMRAIFA